ncbi:MAG: peptidylprolyl isomerase [Thermodesulfobacteriota bacterium]|jgi:peptidylprolyl isomerase
MAEAKQGDTVKVHYTVRLEDGTILGSTTNHEPLQFTIGEGEILPGFEGAIVGMNPGESKTVQVPADEAFGQHQEEMIVVVGRNRLPADLEPKAGESLLFRQEDGKTITVMVTDVSESSVTIDANHPLAGKDLTFDIQFLEIL